VSPPAPEMVMLMLMLVALLGCRLLEMVPVVVTLSDVSPPDMVMSVA
jgi:hypothetical protein